MTIEQFMGYIEAKRPLATVEELEAFERDIGVTLPESYRQFLIACNGGSLGGRLIFADLTVMAAVLGFREDFSLPRTRTILRKRIPDDLLAIINDSFSNAFCLGISNKYRNKMYFWNCKEEPLFGEEWDGRVESAEHITRVADTFEEFVALVSLSPYPPV